MVLTNAQAALQAAATVYGMTDGEVNPDTITGMAYKFKCWLDRKDEADKPVPVPVPVEEVSHHISCSTRLHGLNFGCDCTPVPYGAVYVDIMPKLPSSLGHPDNPGPLPKPGPRPSLCSFDGCQRAAGHSGHHEDRSGWCL